MAQVQYAAEKNYNKKARDKGKSCKRVNSEICIEV